MTSIFFKTKILTDQLELPTEMSWPKQTVRAQISSAIGILGRSGED